MLESDNASVTDLILAARPDDPDSQNRLFARVYGELKVMARQVRSRGPDETLTTTALVHEAYLKLVPSANRSWEGRNHFFGAAARAMRQILVDAARRHLAAKRANAGEVAVDELRVAAPLRPERLVALDEALERLAAMDPRRARVVEHRVFGGLTTAETAALLGVGTATVERDWRAARAWLAAELAEWDP